MLPKPTLEFVIPIFNERECVDALVQRLVAFRTRMNSLDVTFTFVNDGSSDGTWERLLEHASTHSFLQLIDLSRNFGHQVAVTAGLDHADADFVAIMDGDLQDPPEVVEAMLAKAAEGYDVVYGQRTSRRGETWFKRATAFAFYRIAKRIFRVTLPEDTGDFRLITRKAHRSLRSMRERHRFLRGMVPWLGFRSAGVRYDRDLRHAGVTKYPLVKMIRFALDAIFSFSMAPLRVMSLMGLLTILLAALGAAYMLYLKLVAHRVVPGATAILVTMIFLGGVQISMLGLMGEYLGRIFEESKQRPLYFVNEIKNPKRANQQAGASTEASPVL